MKNRKIEIIRKYIDKDYPIKQLGNLYRIEEIEDKEEIVKIVKSLKEHILSICFKKRERHFLEYKNFFVTEKCNPPLYQITSMVVKYCFITNRAYIEMSLKLQDEILVMQLTIKNPKGRKSDKTKSHRLVGTELIKSHNVINYKTWSRIWFDIKPEELTAKVIEDIVIKI